MKLTKTQIKNRRKWADALQTSKQGFEMLYIEYFGETRRCCLGVCASVVSKVPNETLVKYAYLTSLDRWTQYNGIMDSVGLTPEEEKAFVMMNDGIRMSHPDIGLYLYFTCESGETFDYTVDEIRGQCST